MSRRWRSVLLGSAVILGPLLLGVGWIELTASRRWAETLKRSEELAVELASPIAFVPLPHGEPLAGNAWDDYVSAKMSADVAGFSGHEDILKFVRRQSGAQQAAAESALVALEPALAHLRVGARRAIFQYREDPLTASGLRTLTPALHARAMIHARAGRTGEAFALLAELVRIGQHLAHESTREGSEICEAGLEDIGDLLRHSKPPRSDLEALLRDLSILEMGMPMPGRCFLGHRGFAIQALIAGNFPSGPRIAPGWRHAWSRRIYLSKAADRIESWARTLQALKDRPWPEADRFIADELAEAEISGNDLLRRVAWGKSVEMEHWTLRARLQLVRAVLLFRMTGDKATLPDPFGKTLQWNDEGVRSVGPTEDPEDDLVLRIK